MIYITRKKYTLYITTKSKNDNSYFYRIYKVMYVSFSILKIRALKQTIGKR